jgi:hypothetical protein
MAGHEMIRRFTWELVYQNNKEGQEKFGVFQKYQQNFWSRTVLPEKAIRARLVESDGEEGDSRA